MPTPRLKALKQSVYVLEDANVPGLYYDVAGKKPRAVPFVLTCMAPAAPEYRARLCAAAVRELQGVPYDLVRVDPGVPRVL